MKRLPWCMALALLTGCSQPVELVWQYDLGAGSRSNPLVTDAFTRNDPLELEQELDRSRWKLAEELIGQDPFEFEKILAYGIQLKIVERWNRMDVSVGKETIEAVITANTEKEETAEA